MFVESVSINTFLGDLLLCDRRLWTLCDSIAVSMTLEFWGTTADLSCRCAAECNGFNPFRKLSFL